MFYEFVRSSRKDAKGKIIIKNRYNKETLHLLERQIGDTISDDVNIQIIITKYEKSK